VVVVAAVGSFSFGTRAEAQVDEPGLEECMDQVARNFALSGSCRRVDGGEWEFVDDRAPGFGDVGGGFGSFIGLLFIVGLFWSAVPMILAANLASSRGDPIWASVLTAAVAGWVGVVIMYWSGRSGANGTATSSAPNAELSRVNAPVPPAPAVRDELEARLYRLDQLREGGVISDTEWSERRAEILDEI
jgi:hypothetical protein